MSVSCVSQLESSGCAGTHLWSQVSQDASADLSSVLLLLLLLLPVLCDLSVFASCFYTCSSNPNILRLIGHMLSGKCQSRFSNKAAASWPRPLPDFQAPLFPPPAPPPPPPSRPSGGGVELLDNVKDQSGGI